MALEIVMPRLSDSMEEGRSCGGSYAAGALARGGCWSRWRPTRRALCTRPRPVVPCWSSRAEGESVRVGALIALLGEPGASVEVVAKRAPLGRRHHRWLAGSPRSEESICHRQSGRAQGRVTRADVDAAAASTSAPAAVNGAKGGSRSSSSRAHSRRSRAEWRILGDHSRHRAARGGRQAQRLACESAARGHRSVATINDFIVGRRRSRCERFRASTPLPEARGDVRARERGVRGGR